MYPAEQNFWHIDVLHASETKRGGLFKPQCETSELGHSISYTSRKHAYIILTPLNPTFI